MTLDLLHGLAFGWRALAKKADFEHSRSSGSMKEVWSETAMRIVRRPCWMRRSLRMPVGLNGAGMSGKGADEEWVA